MSQGNQNVAFVVLIFAVGLGGYSWGHNVGQRLATSAILIVIQPAPPTPAGHATPREEEDAETIKLLSDHIDDQKELIDHLLKDIEKLEAIIRELRRPVPKEAVRELRMRGQGGAISHPFVQRFWQADGPPSADRGTYRG